MTEIPPLRLSSIFYFNIPQTFCASGCTSAGAKCRCGRSIFPPHQKRGNFLLTRIVICGILIKRLRDTVRRSGGTGRRPGLKIPWVVIPVPVRSRFAARLRALIHTNRSSFSISIFQPSAPTTSLAAARSVLRDAAARRPSLLASMQYHSR